MQSKKLVLAMIVVLPALLFVTGCSDDARSPNPSSAESDATQATASEPPAALPDAEIVLVNNALCPISGEAVGSMEAGSHIDYKGHRVGLCCSGCEAAFLKDADTNLAKAQAESAESS